MVPILEVKILYGNKLSSSTINMVSRGNPTRKSKALGVDVPLLQVLHLTLITPQVLKAMLSIIPVSIATLEFRFVLRCNRTMLL